MKAKALAAAVLLSMTALAQAQDKAAASPFTFALHGFVSMSACAQFGSFGLSECQQSIMAAVAPTTDKGSLSFDVRQSRFNFSVKGPQVLGGATPTGVLEIDFFQGFGGGNYGASSLLNRLRLAYSELNWGGTKLQLGQQNDLVFAMAPVSISHIAFPLGYMTGNIGWRRPGIFGYHNFGSGDVKMELAWEVARSQWADASLGGGATSGVTIGGAAPNKPFGVGQGEASGLPALEARFTFNYQKLVTAWIAEHWNQVDLNGVGTSGGNTIDVQATALGAKLNFAPVTLAATGFFGKNVAPLVANFTEFKLGPNDADVTTFGIWAQAGVNITNEFSLWAFYGMQKPSQSDAKSALFTRLDNQTINVLAQYRDGGYGLSAEWIRFDTNFATYQAAAPFAFISKAKETANEVMLTGTYFF